MTFNILKGIKNNDFSCDLQFLILINKHIMKHIPVCPENRKKITGNIFL